MAEWAERRYIIVDEIRMRDGSLNRSLHTQLGKLKSLPELKSGGLDILFFRGFLQIPSVSKRDLYIDSAVSVAQTPE